MIFEWLDTYNLNVKEIDDQHHQLVDILNRLNTFITKGAPAKDSWLGLINELSDYAYFHFKTEESLMTRHAFEYAEEHQEDHAFFKNKIEYFKVAFETDDMNAADEMLYFLMVWLQNHILIVDHKLCVFLNKKGII
ncbi:MAG: hemerythrin family protein [Candidatus Omnitrophica bacterium]|nr:hemerythrin family protein [Candidatus Omnitrophota bacterium]